MSAPAREPGHQSANSDDPVPAQRVAVIADLPRIAALMRSSVLELFPKYYDGQQTRSAAVHIAHVDRSLIDDGTYFVHEVHGEIVACGGWSKRDRLYTGSGDDAADARLLEPATEPARVRAMFVRGDWTRRGLGRAILESCERAALASGFHTLALMATLPGVPLYRSFGFAEVEATTVTMPDGVTIATLAMARPIDPGWEPALSRVGRCTAARHPPLDCKSGVFRPYSGARSGASIEGEPSVGRVDRLVGKGEPR